MCRSPNFVSIDASLFWPEIGENRQRVSFYIIVNCIHIQPHCKNQVCARMWGKKKLQMGWQKIQSIVFNLLNMSRSIGWSPCPHTSMTSSQAHSCQVVWDANNIIAHVKRVVIVSCPVMKKVLQLSINSCMPKCTFPPTLDSSFFYSCIEHETQQVISIWSVGFFHHILSWLNNLP